MECRLCATSSKKNLVELFDSRFSNGPKVKAYVMLATGIQIESGDGMGSRVCTSCIRIAMTSYLFRSTAIETNRMLRERKGIASTNKPSKISVTTIMEKNVRLLSELDIDVITKPAIGDSTERFQKELREKDKTIADLQETIKKLRNVAKRKTDLGTKNNLKSKSKKSLSEYTQTELNHIEETVKCQECNNSFSSQMPFCVNCKENYNAEQKLINFNCKICDSNFTCEMSLYYHYTSKHDVRSNESVSAKESRSEKTVLDQSATIHNSQLAPTKTSPNNNQRKLRCKICKWKYQHEEELYKHSKRRHTVRNDVDVSKLDSKEITNEQKHYCELCKTHYTSDERLLSHYEEKHAVRENEVEPKKNTSVLKQAKKTYNCRICNNTPFSSQITLLNHCRQMHSVRNDRCVIQYKRNCSSSNSMKACPKRFKKLSSCHLCNITFESDDDLSNHRKNTHNICGHCNVDFKFKSDLEQHLPNCFAFFSKVLKVQLVRCDVNPNSEFSKSDKDNLIAEHQIKQEPSDVDELPNEVTCTAIQNTDVVTDDMSQGGKIAPKISIINQALQSNFNTNFEHFIKQKPFEEQIQEATGEENVTYDIPKTIDDLNAACITPSNRPYLPPQVQHHNVYPPNVTWQPVYRTYLVRRPTNPQNSGTMNQFVNPSSNQLRPVYIGRDTNTQPEDTMDTNTQPSSIRNDTNMQRSNTNLKWNLGQLPQQPIRRVNFQSRYYQPTKENPSVTLHYSNHTPQVFPFGIPRNNFTPNG